jgi:phage-related protein
LRSSLAPGERPIYWVASSKRDLLRMPRAVVRRIGAALSVAQYGGKHPDAKPWRGEGPGVLEVVCDFEGSAFRAIYVVKFSRAIYVLHCFQKKSPRGSKTARADVDLVATRLKAVRAEYEATYGKDS